MAKKPIAVLVLLVIILSLATPSFAQNKPETTAESAILIDATSGKILYSKDIHTRRPMASVTKLMTLLVIFDALNEGKVKLTDKVVTSENAWKLGGSQIWLEPGEAMSLKQLIIAIAVGSANDACVAVAEHIGGSMESFVDMMNERAKKLGLKDTHFVNPYGLPAEGHYTSAYDMAMIAKEAIKYPDLLKVTSIKHYELRGGKTRLDNTNKLLWWYPGADGLKTGWTNEAKYCLASTVERDGFRMISVVLATPEPRSHFRESMKLFSWGFSNYQAVPLAERNQKLGKIPVNKGVADYIDAVPETKINAVVLKGQDKGIAKEIILKKALTAPVTKGEKVGEVIVRQKGEELFRVDLVASKAVKKGTVIRHFEKLLNKVILFQ